MNHLQDFKCKIDSHIPTEDGSACECGYFKQNLDSIHVDDDLNRKDGIYE
jgi:hypothetical protein